MDQKGPEQGGTHSGRRRININGAMNAHRPEEVIVVKADTINAQATVQLYDSRSKPLCEG